MNFHVLSFQWSILLFLNIYYHVNAQNNLVFQKYNVMAVILSRNEEPFLPYFLSLFQRLNYPKDKISLFIRSGNNDDKTADIFSTWLATNFDKYHSIDVNLENENWNYEVFAEEALKEARNRNFEYIWILNQKTFITNRDILQSVFGEKLIVAAPLVTNPKSYYSNFWGKITDQNKYARSKDYIDIVQREKKGCYNVPVLEFLFLIDLRSEKSKFLTFNKDLLTNYTGPSEAKLVFSESAKRNKIYLHICNIDEYGFVKSPFHNDVKSLKVLKEYLHKIKILHNITEELLPFMAFPNSDKFGFDQIYVINLARRPLRKALMEERLRAIGVNATFYEAIDGKTLNETYLKSRGFQPNKYFKNIKGITNGIIGNALSHYSIWEQAVRFNYSKIMVLEDDAAFDEKFGEHLTEMLDEIEEIKLQWDFIYLGRGNNDERDQETLVNNTRHLVLMNYRNYRAFGYMINQSGARKLYKQEFISNLVPTGDYFYLKYIDPHKREAFNEVVEFEQDLKAYSIHPLIVHHSFYYNNGRQESDTVHSPQFSKEFEQFSVERIENLMERTKDEL